MSAVLLPLIHLTQAVTTLYTGLLSYISIQKVRTYESMTEKAAKYSNIAEHHLKTTQTTQGAGAVATLSSLGLSLYLGFSRMAGRVVPVLLCTVEAAALVGAYVHIGDYWKGKAKVPVPGSGDYNDAISTSNQMRKFLGGLAVSWGVVAVWYFGLWVS